jgi:hypothetical protein
METPYSCTQDFMDSTEKILLSIDLSIQKLFYKYLHVRIKLLNFIFSTLLPGICVCEGNFLYGDFI